MTPTEAQHTLELLAQGLHPQTLEPLPANQALEAPQVIRALFMGAQALALVGDGRKLDDQAVAKDAPEAPRQRPAKAGQGWASEEDEQLVQAFDAGTAIKVLATMHERSRGAIRSRLIKLGKLSE